MANTIVDKIIKEIEAHAPSTQAAHVGAVTAVGDGVVAIDGLSKAVMSEVVLFEEGQGKPLFGAMNPPAGRAGELFGLVLNLEVDSV